MNTPTDTQLKQALAKMLSELIEIQEQGHGLTPSHVLWYSHGYAVLDTELLYLCWLVEETLNKTQIDLYLIKLGRIIAGIDGDNDRLKCYHATWQQRTIALCELKYDNLQRY